MPTYEFRCPKGHEFTRFFKTMSSAAMQLPCPECSAVADRQLSAGGGLLFKGSGFYLTDYGKNAHRQEGGRRREEGGEKTSDAPAKADAPAASNDAAKPKAESREPTRGGASAPEHSSRELKAESPKKAESREPKAESPKKAKSSGRKSE